MIWSYGSYTSDLNEARIAIQSEELRSRFGVIYGYRRVISISGRIIRTTRSDLLTRIAALKSACSADGSDLTWTFADATDSGESMGVLNTTGGVRATPPAFPNGEGGEFSTWRDYTVKFEGTIPVGIGLGANPTIEFEETVDHTNPDAGGAFVLVPLVGGTWQTQNTYPTGKHTMVQSGTIVGLYAYPNVPSPITTSSPPLVYGSKKITPKTPRVICPDGTRLEFPVSYSYTFESPTAMTLSYPSIP